MWEEEEVIPISICVEVQMITTEIFRQVSGVFGHD
jgi:hypothetical protein